MAGIIVIILKIIGIILLSILALLLILAGVFLFLPVKYQLRGSKDAEKTEASLVVNWLFHLLCICVEYGQESGLVYSVKLLGFQIFPQRERQEKVRKPKKQKKKQKTDKTKESRNTNHKKAEISQNVTESVNRDEVQKEKLYSKTTQQKADIPKELPVLEKKSLFGIIKEKIIKLKFTFGKICGKIKEICSGYEKCKEFITSEEVKGSLKFLNKQKKYLIRHLKPSKADVYLHFGTEDPALTGEILAGLSVLYPFYGYKFNVEPDFEQVCFEGNLFIKGKIQCYVALVTVWRAYKNKHIRNIIDRIRK